MCRGICTSVHFPRPGGARVKILKLFVMIPATHDRMAVSTHLILGAAYQAQFNSLGHGPLAARAANQPH